MIKFSVNEKVMKRPVLYINIDKVFHNITSSENNVIIVNNDVNKFKKSLIDFLFNIQKLSKWYGILVQYFINKNGEIPEVY